jgi:predicted  nucleic acid-binding Zn-ribbon protein
MAADASPCDSRTILQEATPPILELQRLDTQAAELRRHLATLPARAALTAGEAEQIRVEAERSLARERRRALDLEERALSATVTDLVAGMSETEARLYSGSVRAPKELLGLQHELDGMKVRRRRLEEEEYELLERSEGLAREMEALDGRTEALEREGEALRAEIAAATTETDLALERIAGSRATVVPGVPSPLLAAYEKLRTETRLGGMVTARFDGKGCGGCNTTLPIVAASQILREPDTAVVQCPRCRRLLVR